MERFEKMFGNFRQKLMHFEKNGPENSQFEKSGTKMARFEKIGPKFALFEKSGMKIANFEKVGPKIAKRLNSAEINFLRKNSQKSKNSRIFLKILYLRCSFYRNFLWFGYMIGWPNILKNSYFRNFQKFTFLTIATWLLDLFNSEDTVLPFVLLLFLEPKGFLGSVLLEFLVNVELFDFSDFSDFLEDKDEERDWFSLWFPFNKEVDSLP